MTVWLTIAALSTGTIAIKSAGPVAFSRYHPSRRSNAVITLIAPALLAALVVYETIAAGSHRISLDARVVGLAAAALALRLRLPLIAVIGLSAAAAALAHDVG